MRNPSKKKRDWLEQIKKEGLTKKRAEDEPAEDPSIPKVAVEGMWLWRCFNILNAHRQYGRNGPQPITIADMYAMAVIEELDKADTRFMCEVVDHLDRVYVEETYDRLAKEQAARSKKPGTSVRRR